MKLGLRSPIKPGLFWQCSDLNFEERGCVADQPQQITALKQI
ncbi:MAG: hypothetical protein ABIR24_15125 [Verrucomicrobiota bacterium]